MLLRHYFLILIITFLFGSAYPVQKVIFNENVPPLLMGSLRMLVVFICLLPFWRFRIPEKKYWLPLLFFSISMGFLANVFMTLSLNEANIVSPIIIGSQLAVPFAILLSSFFLKEKVSIKKWVLIFISFFGIILLGFDPLIRNEIFALILITLMAFFYASAQVFSRYLIVVRNLQWVYHSTNNYLNRHHPQSGYKLTDHKYIFQPLFENFPCKKFLDSEKVRNHT